MNIFNFHISKIKGFTLLEIMIALTIFSFAVLIILGYQRKSFTISKQSHWFQLSSQIALDLLTRIQINHQETQSYFSQSHWETAFSEKHNNQISKCTNKTKYCLPDEIAQSDMSYIALQLKYNIPHVKVIVIECNQIPSLFCLTISWSKQHKEECNTGDYNCLNISYLKI